MKPILPARAVFFRLNLVRMGIVSIAVMVAMLIYEHALLGVNYNAERSPRLHPYDVFRSLVAFVLSIGLARALWKDGSHYGGAIVPRLPLKAILVSAAVTVFAVWCAWLFSRDARLFNALSLEDGLFEWLSALFLFAASAFFALLAIGQLAGTRSGGGRQAWALGGAGVFFALTFFVIGMEEISWMQRVFDVATPQALVALNDQKEFNFHNISTGASELVYYNGAFFLLVFVPFIGLFVKGRLKGGVGAALMPSAFVLAASAPMAAFNSGRWGVLPTQISVMMTVIILLVLVNLALRYNLWKEFLLFAGMAISIVAIQKLFLVESGRLLRLWDPSEYKELFIAAGLALYAGETWWRLRQPRKGLAGHA